MAVAMLVIGTALAVVGTIASAKAQRDKGYAEQQAYNYNADVQEGEAEAVEEEAAYNEEIYREKVQNLLSTQRANYGASGVVMSVGSPLAVFADTAMKGEKDALMIRYGGSVEATSRRNEAQLSRLYGATARRAGRVGSVTTLLSGLGRGAIGFGVGGSRVGLFKD